MIDLQESNFPGNEKAFEELARAADSDDLIIITGAGVSAPKMPLWSNLIKILSDDLNSSGTISKNDRDHICEICAADPLTAATLLQNECTNEILKSKISKIFGDRQHTTEVIDSLLDIPAVAHLTLNYDYGLENSFIRKFSSLPKVLNSSDEYNLGEISRIQKGDAPAIIQWHGSVSNPSSIVFTSQDYDNFYSRRGVPDTFNALLRAKTVLFVGFGFSDPYLTRLIKEVNFNSGSEERHFAIVSEDNPSSYSGMKRKAASINYRCKLIVYGSENSDHSQLLEITKALSPQKKSPPLTVPDDAPPPTELSAMAPLEQHLAERILNSGGRPLFVIPRIAEKNVLDENYYNDVVEIKSEDVATSEGNIMITSPHEYGISTLGDILEYHMKKSGKKVAIRSAIGLPNYEAKLLRELRLEGEGYHTLILDDVRPTDSKMLSALRRLDKFERYIFLSHDESLNNAIDLSDYEKFRYLTLLPLNRVGLSSLADRMASDTSRHLLSGVVEKVYTDLLSLAIPLTPANVVMYLSVAFRDYSFSPLSRLQIIEKYIESRISRASDAYQEAFNSTNKIDLISKFVYSRWEKGEISFTKKDWDDFCTSYKEDKLISFNHAELLRDLEDSRVVVFINVQERFHFSYRIFFCYFFGKFLVDRPDLYKEKIKNGEYLAVEGLVEILTGLSKDNADLLEDLTARMNSALNSFYSKYAISDFDPHRLLKWETREDDEKQEWSLVEESLNEGPLSQVERDEKQKDVIQELRSQRQGVTINEDILEQNANVADLISALGIAISNSVDVDGGLKIRAAKVAFSTYMPVCGSYCPKQSHCC
jgi:hypothetical protein